MAAISALAAVATAAVTAFSVTNQLRVVQQGQLSDRFGRATEQLGSSALDVRLGGIYSLERLTTDSPDDQPAVVEVLSAYVRERTSGGKRAQEQLATDIQAALTVIGRRNPSHDDARRPIDLKGAELSGANLVDANLAGAYLVGVKLRNANLVDANLDQANLRDTILDGSDLGGAKMAGTNLTNANLAYTNFTDANFFNANFDNAYLDHAKLTSANLANANLTNARLTNADLGGAVLTGTKLPCATRNLNVELPTGAQLANC